MVWAQAVCQQAWVSPASTNTTILTQRARVRQHVPQKTVHSTNARAADTANIISALSALFFFGCAVGSLAQSFLADWLGRRKSLAIAGVIALLGGALTAGSVAVPMLIVFRLFQGVGLGMLLALVPLYLTEVAPPRTRGFLTGLTTLSFGTGYVMYVPVTNES